MVSSRRRRWYRQVYLRSRHWLAVREWALDRAGRRCEKCGLPRAMGNPLDVHHLTYRNLWYEAPGDVLVLCRRCHEVRHGHSRSWWRRLLGV